jgi:UDP-N-acetylglucosamine--N-acetylmuramyl-(pentapeptide) pyrophosphoryl-undecaprenol N-acetylglucosamine transferase
MQAIAEALVSAGVAERDIRYVGSRRGQEATLLSGGAIALTLLPGRGIRRSLSARAWRDNAGALVALASAFARALIDVRRWRPRAVVSVGGYAAAATSSAAVLWRRPLVLVDLDARPSVTHRLLARFATVRCVALGAPSDRVEVTGAPVRSEIAGIDRSLEARGRAKMTLDPPIDAVRRVVVVMTGSLGATKVNRAVLELARLWRDRTDLALVQVTGRRDFDMVTSERPDVAGLDYRVIDFADMPTWWAVADLAICRAGATTVAELTTLGIPAVLLPLPGAPGDHQTHNALALSDVGAAMVVPDSACTGEALARVAETMLQPELWVEMSRACALVARPDAAAQIARVVISIGGGS